MGCEAQRRDKRMYTWFAPTDAWRQHAVDFVHVLNSPLMSFISPATFRQASTGNTQRKTNDSHTGAVTKADSGRIIERCVMNVILVTVITSFDIDRPPTTNLLACREVLKFSRRSLAKFLESLGPRQAPAAPFRAGRRRTHLPLHIACAPFRISFVFGQTLTIHSITD